ncbi:MAG TPA: hypothetical protein VIF62_23480 [Labilithrix sp.]|jgi:hypothetical protein
MRRSWNVRIGVAALLLAPAAFAQGVPAPDATANPTATATAPTTANPTAPTTANPDAIPPLTADANANAAPPSAEAPAKEPGVVKPWRFTGMIGVVSLPRVLSLDVLARFRRKDDPRWDLFAVGAGIDWLPPGLANFDTTKFSWLQLGADGRFFPWRWLFVGARIGWQDSRADATKLGSEIVYSTSSFVLAPKVGAIYTLPNGLTFGGELGAGIPIGATTSQSTEDAADSNARKVAKTFGMFVMPFLSARIGYTL